MSLVTKATRGAVAGNAWTSPANATASDNVYATAAPAKNGSVSGDWDFAAFTDAEIPVGSTINSVTLRAEYNVNTQASVATLDSTRLDNAVTDGTASDTSEPLADTNWDSTFTTTPSETDLKTVGAIVSRLVAKRGNSSTAVTFNLDYVELRVDYSQNVAVTPGSASLTLTGSAPTVTATDNKLITPLDASLSLTSSAPAVVMPQTVSPGAASFVLSGAVPSVAAGVGVSPGAGTLVLIGSAPAVAASQNVTVTPGSVTLVLTGFAPNVLIPIMVAPAAAALMLTAYAPTVSLGGNVAAIPNAAALLLAGYAPIVSAGGAVISGGPTPGGRARSRSPRGRIARSGAPSGSAW